jgi:hypothetical protein
MRTLPCAWGSLGTARRDEHLYLVSDVVQVVVQHILLDSYAIPLPLHETRELDELFRDLSGFWTKETCAGWDECPHHSGSIVRELEAGARQNPVAGVRLSGRMECAPGTLDIMLMLPTTRWRSWQLLRRCVRFQKERVCRSRRVQRVSRMGPHSGWSIGSRTTGG